MEGLIFGTLRYMKRELVKNGERVRGYLDLRAQFPSHSAPHYHFPSL